MQDWAIVKKRGNLTWADLQLKTGSCDIHIDYEHAKRQIPVHSN